MNKGTSSLASTIAKLGSSLADRQHGVEKDLVVTPAATPKHRTKNLAVRLHTADLQLLDDLEVWFRQRGLRVGHGTLMKAGIRLLKKNEQGIQAVRQILDHDRRRRNGPH